MKSFLTTIGGRKVVMTEPNGLQYGHLGIEILMTLSRARELGADAYFVRPNRLVAAALLDLETSEVRILRPGYIGRLGMTLRWRQAAFLTVLRAWLKRCHVALADEALFEINRQLHRASLVPLVKKALRKWREHWRTVRAEPSLLRKARRPYFLRQLIREPLPVFLPEAIEAKACAEAKRLGIAPGAKTVTVHVREPGYKSGREQADKGSWRDDATRNARIETHFPAIDYLVSEGYTVVRIGDPSMVPVERPGVIDLATVPDRQPHVELHCLLRSDFLLCGESGPLSVSYLTNTPHLVVNSTDPINAYPARPDGLYMLKHVVDLVTGCKLSLSQMLEPSYYRRLRDTDAFEYLDNSPDEILSAVQEMLQWVRGECVEHPLQAEFRNRATESGIALRASHGYVRKWGPDSEFLGDGRVVAGCAKGRL